MLAVEHGGRLYRVGGDTIAGRRHGRNDRPGEHRAQVGSQHRTYINGSLRHSMSSPGGSFYDKFGSYRTDSGAGPIARSVWSGVRFWRK